MWALLLLCVILFLAFMFWRGRDVGIVRMALGLAILIVSVFIAILSNSLMSGIIKNNFSLYDKIHNQIYDYVDEKSDTALDDAIGKVQQRRKISAIPIPEPLKKVLIENNNTEVYKALKVNTFSEYVSSYLATIIIKIASFIVTMILLIAIINIALYSADVFTKLPVIKQLNELLGGIIGFIEGMLIIWLACLILTAISTTDTGIILLDMINSSKVMSMIYNNNLLGDMIINILQRFM